MSNPNGTDAARTAGRLKIQRSHTYIATSRWVDGDPAAEVDEHGQITTRPTGDSGDLYLSIGIAKWRAWNAVVEAAIAKHRDERLAEVAAGLSDAAAEYPVEVGQSPMLKRIMESEGL